MRSEQRGCLVLCRYNRALLCYPTLEILTELKRAVALP